MGSRSSSSSISSTNSRNSRNSLGGFSNHSNFGGILRHLSDSQDEGFVDLEWIPRVIRPGGRRAGLANIFENIPLQNGSQYFQRIFEANNEINFRLFNKITYLILYIYF